MPAPRRGRARRILQRTVIAETHARYASSHALVAAEQLDVMRRDPAVREDAGRHDRLGQPLRCQRIGITWDLHRAASFVAQRERTVSERV